MDRQAIIENVLDREWDMFQNVQNVGGRASCQEDSITFRIMRRAQFEGWDDETLASYQNDLAEAETSGHNLLSEKYGYMMKWTFPDEYEQIKDLLPPVSAEKAQLVEEILDIELRQTAKFREMYPNIGRQGRPLTAAEDHLGTSVETYTRGELLTYSCQTLRKHLEHLRKLDQKKILYPMIIMKATVRAGGYLSLDEAERALK